MIYYTEKGTDPEVIDISHISKMFTTLVVWLSCEAGLSRYAANIALKSVAVILGILLELISFTLAARFNITVEFTSTSFKFPKDIRFAYKQLNVEPDIIETGICPDCFRIVGHFDD